MKTYILILFVILAGCVQAQPQLQPQSLPEIVNGTFLLHTNIVVTEDWCYLPDKTRVNGVTTYNPQLKQFSDICVSLKSDDPHRTLKHELEHAWRNAVGMGTLWAGHNVHCTLATC